MLPYGNILENPRNYMLIEFFENPGILVPMKTSQRDVFSHSYLWTMDGAEITSPIKARYKSQGRDTWSGKSSELKSPGVREAPAGKSTMWGFSFMTLRSRRGA